MYEGKPKLKKINKTNFNNPTLSSMGMRGIFYQPVDPTIVRDELRYNAGFKDSLQQTVEQEQIKRRTSASDPKYYMEQPNPTTLSNEYTKIRYKNQLLDKVTQIPMRQGFDALNYKGHTTIKTKQSHGFDIIKNF